MTVGGARMTVEGAGMTVGGAGMTVNMTTGPRWLGWPFASPGQTGVQKVGLDPGGGGMLEI